MIFELELDLDCYVLILNLLDYASHSLACYPILTTININLRGRICDIWRLLLMLLRRELEMMSCLT